ncbi:ankyrin, partial [Morchella conica CCBAS932]
LARLLRDGWSPNTADSKNRTPRHCAANHGCRTIVSQLIDAGANPNAENDAMKTPLHLATSHGYEGTVSKYYSRMGQIDPNIKDNDPCTPIHWAIRCRSVASVYLLLQVGADALIPEINGYTALYLATRNRSYACVLNELLQDGVDADAQDERGHPPLLRAF